MREELLIALPFLVLFLVTCVSAADEALVIVVPSTHMDIDFTDTPDRCLAKYDEFIARAVSELRRDRTLTFNIEHVMAVKHFVERARKTPGGVSKAVNVLGGLLKEGRVEVSAAWTNPHFADLSGELMVREVVTAKDYLRRTFGYDPVVIKTGELADITPQLAQVCAKCGVLAFQTTKTTGFVYTGKGIGPGPYWFCGLDGTRALFIEQTYGMPGFRAGAEALRKWMPALRSWGGLGIAYYSGGGWDDCYPEPGRVRRELDAASAEVKDVRARLGTQTGYTRLLLDAVRGGRVKLKERVGHSDHGELLYLRWSPKKYPARSRAEDRLPAVEKLFSVASRLGLTEYPQERIDRAWELALNISTHNWANCRGRPTPVFHRWAGELDGLVEKLADEGMRALGSGVSVKGEGVPVLVFNPAAWDRTAHVELELAGKWEKGKIPAFKRAAVFSPSGERVPGGVLPAGRGGTMRLGFTAAVPAMGYRLFYVRPGPVAREGGVKIGRGFIENRFLRISFDKSSGVTSIYDKEARREIVDPNSTCGFGRLMQAPEGAEYPALAPGEFPPMRNLEVARAAAAAAGKPMSPPELLRVGSLRVEEGPGTAEVVMLQGDAEVRVALHSGLKRLDVTTAGGLTGPAHMLFAFAFPRDVEVRASIPYGSMPFWSGEFWEDRGHEFSRRTAGALAFRAYLNEPWHARFIAPGDYPEGGKLAKVEWAHLTDGRYGLLYGMRHTYAGLIKSGNVFYKAVLLGEENSFSFEPASADWKASRAPRFGLEVSSPLLATVLPGERAARALPPEMSFMRLEPEDLVLTVFKKGFGDRSWAVRFYEAHDEDVTGRLRVSEALGFGRAWRARMTEEKEEEVGFDGRTMELQVKGFSIETLVLE